MPERRGFIMIAVLVVVVGAAVVLEATTAPVVVVMSTTSPSSGGSRGSSEPLRVTTCTSVAPASVISLTIGTPAATVLALAMVITAILAGAEAESALKNDAIRP